MKSRRDKISAQGNLSPDALCDATMTARIKPTTAVSINYSNLANSPALLQKNCTTILKLILTQTNTI